MKAARIFLALAIMTMLTAGAVAQKTQKKGGRRVKLTPVAQTMLRLEKMRDTLKTLDLTAEQEAKLKEVQTSMKPKMQGVMKQVTEIVGEEQMKKVPEIAKKAKEAGKSSRQIAVAIEAALNLNDEQKKKLEKVGKELGAAQREIMKQVSGMLTPAQKEKLTAQMRPQKKKGARKNK